MAFIDRGERSDVRYTVDFQRAAGLPRFLAHIFDHGRAVFRWQIFQMRR